MEEAEDQKPLVSSMEAARESGVRAEAAAFGEVRIKAEPVEDDDAYSSALHPSSSYQGRHAGRKRRACSGVQSPVKQRKVDGRDVAVKKEVVQEEEEKEEEAKEEEEKEEALDSLVALRGEDFVVKMDPDFCDEEGTVANASNDVLRDGNASTTVTNTFRQSPVQTPHRSLASHLENTMKSEYETLTPNVHPSSERRVEWAGDESRGTGAGLGHILQDTSLLGSSDLDTENTCKLLPPYTPTSAPYVGAVTREISADPRGSHAAVENGAGGMLQATGIHVPSQITVLVQGGTVLEKFVEGEKVFGTLLDTPGEGGKVFACEACGREFRSQGFLERHLRVTHPDHVCWECDLFFPEPGTRILHTDITHKGKSCGDNLFYLRALKLQTRFSASQGKRRPARQRSTQPVAQRSTGPRAQRGTRKTNQKRNGLCIQKSPQPTRQKGKFPTTQRSKESFAERSDQPASQERVFGRNCSSSAYNADGLSDDAIRDLIGLFRSHDSLFDPTSEAFHDRQKTREAIESIGVQMGRNWSWETTRQRLRWLQDTYAQCRVAVEKARRGRAAREDVSKITWKWYPLLDTFLGKVCGTTETVMPSLPQTSKTRSPEESGGSWSTLDEEDTGPDSLVAENQDVSLNSRQVLITDIISRNQQELPRQDLCSWQSAGRGVRPSLDLTPHHPSPSLSPSPSTSFQDGFSTSRERKSSHRPSPSLSTSTSFQDSFSMSRERKSGDHPSPSPSSSPSPSTSFQDSFSTSRERRSWHQPSPSPSTSFSTCRERKSHYHHSSFPPPTSFQDSFSTPGERRAKVMRSPSPTTELLKSITGDFHTRRAERRRRRRKGWGNKENCVVNQDVNDTFCVYLGTQMRRLRPRVWKEAQKKILQLLFGLLEEEEEGQS